MAVNSTHPLYRANLPAWSRARDVLAGEDAMKAAGDKYLPRLDSQSDVEYGAYTARASFFGATALTLEGYLDLIFRRAPMSSLPNPERLRGFVEDCDRWGTSFVQYARRVVSETLSVGRAGSLVLQDSSSGRPWVSLWPAEQILNWSVGRVGERTALAEVVLQDGERIRVLRLVESSCVREVWKRIAEPLAEDPGAASTPSAEAGGATGAPTQEGSGGTGPGSQEGFPLRQTSAGQAGAAIEDWVLEERVTVRRDGVPLPFVPFVFHGPRHSEPEPDKLPLADIAVNERESYERIKGDIKHFIESVRAKMPEAAEYLDKHIVMDDEKMTFAYTGDGRIRLEPPF